MTKYKLTIVLVIVAFFLAKGQTPDVFRTEYMYMPKNRGDVETSRIKLVANVPISVRNKNDFLVIGGEYNRYYFEVPDSLIANASTLNKLHIIDLNLAYVYSLNEDWRLMGVITPRWSSNFVDGIQENDFNINYMAGAFKDKKNIEKPYKLVVGLAYNSSSPIQTPLPVLYYEKRFSPKWAYILGVPKSGMRYYTPKSHFFQAELFLDGYYVNIQDNIVLGNNNLSTDVSYTALLLTIGYQYKIAKDMSVYVIGGHSLFQDNALRNDDRKDIFTLNDNTGPYFRTGLRIGI